VAKRQNSLIEIPESLGTSIRWSVQVILKNIGKLSNIPKQDAIFTKKQEPSKAQVEKHDFYLTIQQNCEAKRECLILNID